MEFSYKLTEEDYLVACGINAIPAPPRVAWWIRNGYGLILLASMSLAVAFGLLVGLAQGSGQRIDLGSSSVIKAIGEAVVPAFIAALVYSKIIRFLHRSVVKRRNKTVQLEHFRSDPSCLEETKLSVDDRIVRFQCSVDGYTQSKWSSYRSWIEKENILLLVTKGGPEGSSK